MALAQRKISHWGLHTCTTLHSLSPSQHNTTYVRYYQLRMDRATMHHCRLAQDQGRIEAARKHATFIDGKMLSVINNS